MGMMALLLLVLFLLGCGLAFFASLARIVQVMRLRREVERGSLTPAAAYERAIATAQTRLLYFMIGVVVIVSTAVLIIVIAANALNALNAFGMDSSADNNLGNAILLELFACGFCMYWTYGLVITAANSPTLYSWRGMRVTAGQATRPYLKRLATVLPQAVILEAFLYCFSMALGQVIPSGKPEQTLFSLPGLGGWRLVTGFLALAYFVLAYWRSRSAGLVRWYVEAKPIEETPWAHLAGRVHAWAGRLGVRARAVYVRPAVHSGLFTSAYPQALGSKRGCILFLDEAFLDHSDWRQQDAVVCQHLAFAQSSPPFDLRGGVTELITAYVFVGGLIVSAPLDLLASGDGWSVATIDTAAVQVVLGLVLLLYAFASLRARKRRAALHARIQRADFAAMTSTGDPMAAVVMLNTQAATTNLRPSINLHGFSSLAQRIAAIDALARRPGPRAPWSNELVPSISPVEVHGDNGATLITVPLTEEAKRAEPQPVPAAVYATIG